MIREGEVVGRLVVGLVEGPFVLPVGRAVGLHVSPPKVGPIVGASVEAVGLLLGALVLIVGEAVGCDGGPVEGEVVRAVGCVGDHVSFSCVGPTLGESEDLVGVLVGVRVGVAVGTLVGEAVGMVGEDVGDQVPPLNVGPVVGDTVVTVGFIEGE